MALFDGLEPTINLTQSIAKMNEDLHDSLASLPAALTYSDTQFEILKKYIQAFEKSLDQDHEVGIMLTNFGQSITMAVTEIGYEESVILIFKGYVNGNLATLIQHVSQLNFLLTAVPREPDSPKRKIGFSDPQADAE